MVFWRWFCDYYFQTTWFKSYTIETNKEDKKTIKEDKKTIKEDKYPSSGIAHSENGRFLYDYEGYGGCMWY